MQRSGKGKLAGHTCAEQNRQDIEIQTAAVVFP